MFPYEAAQLYTSVHGEQLVRLQLAVPDADWGRVCLMVRAVDKSRVTRVTSTKLMLPVFNDAPLVPQLILHVF